MARGLLVIALIDLQYALVLQIDYIQEIENIQILVLYSFQHNQCWIFFLLGTLNQEQLAVTAPDKCMYYSLLGGYENDWLVAYGICVEIREDRD